MQRKEKTTLNKLKKKIKDNNITVTHGDKSGGGGLVFLHTNQYVSKTLQFSPIII